MICAVLTAANVSKLRDTFRDLNPTHRFTSQRLSFIDNPDPGISLKNLYLQTEWGPIDILGTITGVGDFDQVRAGSIEVEMFGRKCRVISVEALIRAKEALGREKDKLAVKELRAIIEKGANDC